MAEGSSRVEQAIGRPALGPAHVAALSRALGEPPALAELRRAGLDLYLSSELPDRVSHLWRYTDPAALLGAAGELPGAGEARPAVTLPVAAAAAGVAAMPLAAAAEVVGRAVPPGHGLFEALNAAAWSGGVAIRVPRGAVVHEPIEVEVGARARASTALPRLLVLIEDGAEATVVERHQGGAGLVVAVSEVRVGAGATLRWAIDQGWGPATVGHLTGRAVVGRDASLLAVVTSLGGRLAKLDLGATLEGPGARAEVVGVTLGEGDQHFDQHTVHRHLERATWSNISLKAALAGRSRSTSTGLIRIEPGATDVDAYQEQRNLLLSPEARADAIPELEILNREVRCSYGVATAPLDPEQVFYLRSRGLGETAAQRLLVRGFFEGALSRLPAGLRAAVERRIDARLDRLEGRRR